MIRQRLRHELERRHRGQVLVLFALMAFVVVGFTALSVDAGYLLNERREAQNAADAAAIAGGVSLLAGETVPNIHDAAVDYAEKNGISTANATVSIDVDVDEDTGVGLVEVEIQRDVERFFVGAIYTGDWQVSARAVAEVVDDSDGNYALMALDPPGMNVNGNIEIHVNGGGAMSNGDISNSGNSNANVFDADTFIDAHGTISGANANWTAPGGLNSNRPVSSDPLSGADAPNPDDLPVGVHDCNGNNDCTMEPGLYEDMGNINIRRTATLEPGVYHFKGTSLSLHNTNSRIEGDGVMLYFDEGSSTSSTYFYPKNGEVNLTHPDSDLYTDMPDGMAVWIANCSEYDSQGNNEFYIEGIFYAPCSKAWMHGTPSGEAIRGQVIVGELDIRGNSQFLVEYVGHVETPRHEVFLTE